MTKTTSILALVMGLALSGISAASAQTAESKAYLDLNLAGQTQSVTVATSSNVALFDELATTSSSVTVGKGLVFDGGAGYRVRPDLAIGVAVSLFTRSPTGTVSVSVPDPLVFGVFSSLSAEPPLTQTELGTHIKVAYVWRVNNQMDFTISAGPSFVHLSKQIATATIDGSKPTITVVTQTGNGVGVNGGLEINYMFTPLLGGGVFARYVRADVDLPAVSGVKVGGFQGGLGLRVRF